MTPEQALRAYVLRLGDSALVLGQRMIELVAAYPELEEELANANFALDYIGQARMFYSYAYHSIHILNIYLLSHKYIQLTTILSFTLALFETTPIQTQ